VLHIWHGDVHLIEFTDMLVSIGKFAGFLTVAGVTALAIFLRYYRKRTGVKSVSVDAEVIQLYCVCLLAYSNSGDRFMKNLNH